MSGQVVDTLTAEEFMQQVLQQISHDELRSIAALCEEKSARFSSTLTSGASPSADDVLGLVGNMFGARKKREVLQGWSFDTHALALLDPGVPIGVRFDGFVEAFPGDAGLAGDVASELLHFADPERYWLWTRWMWDPRTETGSLRLVTMDEFDLDGDTPGATYLRVGEGVAFVNETGRAVGFTDIGGGPFGIDVFLACVYGIYMYTVLRMRMTQEFNQVVPELPELARRLLGVHRMEA